ncbi:MAG: hypothetical protein U5L96_20985 [Owenweeksia sp.]|nr:hypothetical protein [Owenweeksia sp.]
MQSLWFIALVPPRKIIEKLAIHRQYAADHFNAKHALKTTPHITLFPPLRQPGAVMNDVDFILRELFGASTTLQ